MGDVSVGALVPSVTNNGQARMGFSGKDSATESSGGAGNFSGCNENNNVGSDGNLASGNGVELDKDFLCPICMQIIKDAFLTSCGHTFCYMCIVTHLNNKNDCPCCAHYLTNNHLFPNFLLNKLLKKASARQIAKKASPVEHLRLALQQAALERARSEAQEEIKRQNDAALRQQNELQEVISKLQESDKESRTLVELLRSKLEDAREGFVKSEKKVRQLEAKIHVEQIASADAQKGADISMKELDDLLSLLVDKKRKMEQEEAETNMQILLDFLHCLRKQKLQELSEVQTDLEYIKEDINTVEHHRMELYRARERYSVKLRMLDDPMSGTNWPSSVNKHGSIATSNVQSCQDGSGSASLHTKKVDPKLQGISQVLQKRSSLNGSDSQNVGGQSGLAVARRRRVNAQFDDLQECYLQKRRKMSSQTIKQEERDFNTISREGYHEGLEDFQSVLTTFTRYSRLRVLAELRHGDLFHSANIVSSIEFDRDNEFFATAGVSRRIKVFEFSTVVNEPSDVHCPVVEMSTRFKLSCLSWNKYIKNQIASSDYDGIVTVWDVNTRQSIMEYEEHEKRAWSVDFSRTEPSMLVSGSDDCKVKVWCTKEEASVMNIDMKANICCVKYNPGSSRYIAVGSADHHIHYYDLRNSRAPLHVFSGHRKAVSYVKFLSNDELASASTDSTLRLWDVKENFLMRVFKGHTNEKNFVGLTVNREYIACGSETNEVFVYHKAISKPAAWHRFGSPDVDDADDDAASYFISAVCWKSDSPTMLTANSQGTIKVLVLAP